MTLNGVIALTLPYFTEFGTFLAHSITYKWLKIEMPPKESSFLAIYHLWRYSRNECVIHRRSHM